MPHRATFEALRARAYELADSGRCADWRQIAAELEFDGFVGAAQRLKADPMLQRMLDARCAQARDRNA